MTNSYHLASANIDLKGCWQPSRSGAVNGEEEWCDGFMVRLLRLSYFALRKKRFETTNRSTPCEVAMKNSAGKETRFIISICSFCILKSKKIFSQISPKVPLVTVRYSSYAE